MGGSAPFRNPGADPLIVAKLFGRRRCHTEHCEWSVGVAANTLVGLADPTPMTVLPALLSKANGER